MDQQKPKTHKNDDNEEVRGNSSHDLPEWLEEMKDNLPKPFWLKCLTQQRLVNRCERGEVPGESDVIEAR